MCPCYVDKGQATFNYPAAPHAVKLCGLWLHGRLSKYPGDATNMAAPSAHFSFYSIDDAVTELANPAYFIIGDTEQSIAYDAEIKYDRNFSCVQRKGVNSVLKCCISSFL